MITKFEQSESTRRAISLINQLSGAHCLEINQADYTLIRDFILTQITIANTHRSGVLANMTMTEFHKAKRCERSYIISVKKHKTADIHGPARVVLSPTLFDYLKVFVAEVRSVVTLIKDDDDVVILSWSGARLASGQISTAINAAWKKAGIEGHISSTLFRKSAVTAVHTNYQGMKGQLANLMADKESTAQRYYKLHEKQQSCIKTAAVLPSIMRTNQASEKGTLIAKAEDENPVSAEGSKEKQTTWNEQEKAAVRELFREEINQKRVTMAVGREKIKDHPTLYDQDPKKVYDRVRSGWRGIDKKNHLETAGEAKLPEEEETLSDKMSRFLTSSSDFVPLSNSSYQSKNIFSREEKENLFRLFGATIRSGMISKPAIKDILEKDDAGKESITTDYAAQGVSVKMSSESWHRSGKFSEVLSAWNQRR